MDVWKDISVGTAGAEALRRQHSRSVQTLTRQPGCLEQSGQDSSGKSQGWGWVMLGNGYGGKALPPSGRFK
jgi:hypothetical protein